MSKLFDNAVQSIRLGLEDYQAEDPARTLSAVRNFYAGLLLLAKEVLVRAVPEADEEILLAANYRPHPDGSGGIKFVPRTNATIDLDSIGTRFKDFGLSINHKALKELSQIRNDVEHRFPDKNRDSMRAAISKAFIISHKLFRQAGEEPHVVLNGAWQTMLEVREVYEQERRACATTFEKVDWVSDFLSDLRLKCPECQSDLVEQIKRNNSDQHEIVAKCRSCGAIAKAERLVENSIAGETCPECNLDAYIVGEYVDDQGRCVWCEYTLGECDLCEEQITLDDVGERTNLCSSCDYQWAKMETE